MEVTVLVPVGGAVGVDTGYTTAGLVGGLGVTGGAVGRLHGLRQDARLEACDPLHAL